jgi:hypothetical protein
MFRAPYPSNNSALSLFIKQAAPIALQTNRTGNSGPAIFMTNSGSLRFDIYSGPFTRNDQLTASPFTDSFRFISNITLSNAVAAFNALNNPGTSARRQETEELMARYYDAIKEYERGEVDGIYNSWLKRMDQKVDLQTRAMKNLTLGYVTQDVSFSFVRCLPNRRGSLILFINSSPAQALVMTLRTLR